MYITDQEKRELPLQCFFEEAGVWNHKRGTSVQRIAIKQGDESKRELFLNIDDALEYVLKYELVPAYMPFICFGGN